MKYILLILLILMIPIGFISAIFFVIDPILSVIGIEDKQRLVVVVDVGARLFLLMITLNSLRALILNKW